MDLGGNEWSRSLAVLPTRDDHADEKEIWGFAETLRVRGEYHLVHHTTFDCKCIPLSFSRGILHQKDMHDSGRGNARPVFD